MFGATFQHWLRSAARSLRRQSRRKRKHLSPARYQPRVEQLEDRLVPTTPSVLSINRAVPVGPITNASSVNYAVTFNQSVTGVDATDFKAITSGSVQATSPVAVAGSGAAWTVTVNGIHGSGDLRLDLIDDD